MIADATRRSAPGRARPRRAGRARPRRHGVPRRLGRGGRSTRSSTRSVAYVADAPRASEIQATLASGGRAVLVRDAEQAIAVANLVAPEHLELLTADADELVHEVRHAGAVFVDAPTALGDYVAGANHVLPTGGAARFSERAAGRRLPPPHARDPRHARRAPRARARGGHAGPRRGPRRARRVGRAADRPMTIPEPRADLRELERLPLAAARRVGAAQHEREPVPAAAEFVDAWLPRARGRAAPPLPGPCRDRAARRDRRPARAARGARVPAPTARTRCSRRCCSPTADPAAAARVRADVRAAQPHRAHHRHRGRDRAPARRLPRRSRPRGRCHRARATRHRLRVQPEQPVGDRRAAGHRARRSSRRRPGS